MAASLGRSLVNAFTGPVSKDVFKATLPMAGLNFALGTIGGNPMEGLAYGLGDIALNYPALRLARKVAPGTKQKITNLATGKVTEGYAPSMVENITNVGASIGSGQLVNKLLEPGRIQKAEAEAQQFLAQQAQAVNPALQSQPAQIAQQNIQRSAVNQTPLYQQALAPNTMYQMQGIEQTADNFQYPGITLPPELLAQLQAGGMA